MSVAALRQYATGGREVGRNIDRLADEDLRKAYLGR
jgi:hypothetical protein